MEEKRAIYDADEWHVGDGVATDGTGRPPVKNPVRRSFSAEYKLSILAEYDATVRRGTKVLDDLEAQLEGQIGFARTVTLVLGLALAVGQTVPIAAGWWALRSGSPAADP